MKERIVVTGLGMITPLGIGLRASWANLLAGRCGTGEVTSFDTSAYNVHRGGEVRNFVAAEHVRRLDPEGIGRASQMAVAAAREAVEDAGLFATPESNMELTSELDPTRCGVAMGTTSGEPVEIERLNDRLLAGDLAAEDGRLMAVYPCHLIAGHVAEELGFGGLNTMIPAACAAGNYAVGHAFDALRDRRADVMLAGGADAFSRITYTGFYRLGAIAPERCQPFDKNRRGMLPGEGAAVLVLERLADAERRGARIYAEVAGYGLSCDAHHMTAAHPDGAVRAMTAALETSGVRPEEVGYVSAHGTGTPTNDRLETRALERVFGDSRRVPTSSIKSMIGHTMGAASAIESAVCSLAVSTGLVPPTAHFEESDPECDVDCIPNEAREVRPGVAMNNAYAFGGNNASVLFREVTP